MNHKKITIIGAGVAGLSIAWRLAQAGCEVTLFDKGEAGKGASWAAAGMLSPVMEAEAGEEALLPLLLEAQKQWPDFARELKEYTHIDTGYVESGTLFVGVMRDDVGVLRQRHDFLKKHGLPIAWLENDELRAREPFLSPRASTALFSSHDHQADNRALTQSLLAACQKANVTILENTPVEDIQIAHGKVKAVHAKGDTIHAEQVILCAGAWTGDIKGIPENNRPPVFPVKGQMLSLQMDPKAPLLKHVLWTPRVYLVPRADGRLIVGGTMEDKGFDAHVTAGGMLHLLREAFEVLPGIEELPLIESWAGFRPTSRDDAPILGPSGIEGLTYATGQHRHGILLTPLIARLIKDYIKSGTWAEAYAGFTMKRFG
jgi:glycine oxidase